MTQRRWILLAAAQSLLIALLLGLQFRHAPATADGAGRTAPEDSEGAGSAPASGPTGAAGAAPLTVHLSPAVVAASGIRSAPLQPAQGPSAAPDWAEVQGVTPLAEARVRLQQAEAEQVQWSLQVVAARQEHARADALFREGGNVAQRVVDQAAATLRQLEQRAEAARAAHTAVRSAVQAEFGTAVADALVQPEGGALAGVLRGEQCLLLVASNRPATGSDADVVAAAAPAVAAQGRVLALEGEGPGIPARRFAPATRALGAAAGPSWYWLASATQLRTGQRVRLVASEAGRRRPAGVLLPEGAVVWQAGVAWVWQVLPDGLFVRHSVQPGPPVPGGWVLSASGALQPGLPVVVEGAQLLLSEESRAQIRNENGD